MRKNKAKIYYEPEDDVLNILLSKKAIDYAEDEDYVITHYTKDGEPVYIEVLFASRFFKKNTKRAQQEAFSKVKAAVSVQHRIK